MVGATCRPVSNISSPKVLDHVFTGPQGERHNGNRTGLVGCEGEDTGVTNIEIGHIMTLGEAVGHRPFRVVAEPTGTGFMQALPWRKRIIAGPPELASRRLHQVCTDLL